MSSEPSKSHPRRSAQSILADINGNAATLLAIAKEHDDGAYARCDSLDKKAGVVVAAVTALVVAGAKVDWLESSLMRFLGAAYVCTTCTAFVLALVAYKAMSYHYIRVGEFSKQYGSESQGTFNDRLLSAYSETIEQNRGVNNRKALLLNLAFVFGFLSATLYAIGVSMSSSRAPIGG